MIASLIKTVTCPVGHLSYREAVHIAEDLNRDETPRTFLLDLRRISEATTGALARLVVLRRSLRRRGSDLRLLHLHGKARRMYEINRMSELLPCEAEHALLER